MLITCGRHIWLLFVLRFHITLEQLNSKKLTYNCRYPFPLWPRGKPITPCCLKPGFQFHTKQLCVLCCGCVCTFFSEKAFDITKCIWPELDRQNHFKTGPQDSLSGFEPCIIYIFQIQKMYIVIIWLLVIFKLQNIHVKLWKTDSNC